MRPLLLFTFIFLCGWSLKAKAQQPAEIVTWTFEYKKVDNHTYDIIAQAQLIQPEWHFWTMEPGDEDRMLIPTQVLFDPSETYQLKGSIRAEGDARTSNDEVFGKVNYYAGDATFTQQVQAAPGTKITGRAVFQVCNDKICLPPSEVPFSLLLQ